MSMQLISFRQVSMPHGVYTEIIKNPGKILVFFNPDSDGAFFAPFGKTKR